MAEITSIEPQVKDKTRVSIFIDGRFYCGIKLEVAVKFRLKKGMQIEREELDKIQLETEKMQALEKALNYVAATMKTKKQMRDYLNKKGYVPAVCDYVLEKLAYYGYVDDGAYCKAYISSVGGKGKRALKQALLKRGVDADTIDGALSDYEEDGDEILALLKKYLRGKEINKENIYKGCRYLIGKGYGYEAVKEACEKLDEDDGYRT